MYEFEINIILLNSWMLNLLLFIFAVFAVYMGWKFVVSLWTGA